MWVWLFSRSGAYVWWCVGLEASGECKDLSFSYAKRRESACVKHGGVLEWLAQG
jgi:hypothetical protein